MKLIIKSSPSLSSPNQQIDRCRQWQHIFDLISEYLSQEKLCLNRMEGQKFFFCLMIFHIRLFLNLGRMPKDISDLDAHAGRKICSRCGTTPGYRPSPPLSWPLTSLAPSLTDFHLKAF